MVFALTSITLAVWAIDPADINDRLATDVALLLTLQAFKLVIADKLPKVNYLTFLDIYVVLSFGFIIGGVTMHVGVGWYGHVKEDKDTLLMYVWVSVWLAFNGAFAAYCMFTRKKRGRRLLMEAEKGQF